MIRGRKEEGEVLFKILDQRKYALTVDEHGI